MALDTVSDYIAKSRTILLDNVPPYRYSDSDLVDSLNEAILESKRLRPDFWLKIHPLPSYSSSSETTAVMIPEGYRMAFVYYMTGQAQLQDQEDTQDQRATAFLGKFNSQLTGAIG